MLWQMKYLFAFLNAFVLVQLMMNHGESSLSAVVLSWQEKIHMRFHVHANEKVCIVDTILSAIEFKFP
jgi:hypothetical protein